MTYENPNDKKSWQLLGNQWILRMVLTVGLALPLADRPALGIGAASFFAGLWLAGACVWVCLLMA